MASVHFIAHHDRSNAVSRYRCLNFIDQLRCLGWTANFSFRFQQTPISVSEDIVVLNRVLLDDRVAAFIQELKTAGKAVIYGLDDLVFSGDWADKERAEQDEASAEAVWKQTMGFVEQSRGAMAQCDAALVSTRCLVERCAGMGNEAYLLRNTLPKELVEISERVVRPNRDGKVVLGYSSGTRTHNRDFDSISEALAQILARHENVELMIVGPVQVPQNLTPFESRILRHETVDWRELPALLAQFDINLAPLDLSFAFNHGKSHLKWLEAASVKVPTVASRTEEQSTSIESGVNGFLASTPSEWQAALQGLIADTGMRKRMGEAAFAKVKREFTSAVQATATSEAFESIRTRFCSDPGATVTLAPHSRLHLLKERVRRLLGQG